MYTKMTFEEHLEMGKKIKATNAALSDRLKEASTMLGATHPATRRLRTILSKFGEVRSILDNKVCGDFPERSDKEVTRVYYG
jgi:hypothetical protein